MNAWMKIVCKKSPHQVNVPDRDSNNYTGFIEKQGQIFDRTKGKAMPYASTFTPSI